MHAISIRNLTKRFGKLTAVENLSFDVESGTVTGFVGPNGAGKTTTLRVLLGLTRPDSGQATIDGRPYHALDQPARHLGAMLEMGFHPQRSADDHLRVIATAAGIPDARVASVLEQVGLTAAARRRVKSYSTGMRQRLGLATALLGEPSILVLDEPANGLDPEGVHWLRGILRNHARDGGTVLVSSHLLAELALAADHVVIVKSGRLVAEGAIDDIVSHTTAGVHVRTPEAARLITVLAERGIQARRLGPSELETQEIVADSATTEMVGAAIAEAGIVVYEMRLERTNLEDTFLALTTPAHGEPQ